MSTLDLSTRVKLVAFKHRLAERLEQTEPLTVTAPANRPASDHVDPTADVVLHPARMAVAAAHKRVKVVYRALQIVEEATAALNALEAAVDEWHGLK